MNLEEKIIFLENDIEQLNMAIYQQDKKIIELEKSLQIMYHKFQETSHNSNSELSNNASEETPPHY